MLICIGGNGRSAGFPRTVASPKHRAHFIGLLLKLTERYNLDGVDYNWEYPGFEFGKGYSDAAAIERDYEGLAKLVRETHSAFAPSGRLVSLAYYPDGRQEDFLRQGGVAPYLAAMHMMTYDQGARHSTYEFAEQSARQGLSYLPAERLTLGLPFYGRHVRSGDWKSYEEIVGAWPELEADEEGGYYLNGPSLIERKAKLARELGMGGVMIWEVGQDCRTEAVSRLGKTHVVTCPRANSSLLAAVRRGLSLPDSEGFGSAPSGQPHDEL